MAVQNNYNNLASYLLDHGADPNIPNRFGWLPLFIATDNRNLDAGTMPVRAPDGDPLDLIRKLLDYGANPDGRSRANLQHRTAFDTTWIEKRRRHGVSARGAGRRYRADEAARRIRRRSERCRPGTARRRR